MTQRQSNDGPTGYARSPARSSAGAAVRRRAAAAGALIILLVLLAMYVDLRLAVYLHAAVSKTTYSVFSQISRLGNGGIYAGAALALYVLALAGAGRGWGGAWSDGGRERLARAAMLLMATLASAGLVTWVLKKLVARARPEVFFEHGFYGLGVPFSKNFDSFPSSHTLAAFAVAATLSIIAPAWRWPAFAVAALVAMSRLVTLDHYVSDVIAAAAISITAAHVWAPRILDTRYGWPMRPPWRWFRGAAA